MLGKFALSTMASCSESIPSMSIPNDDILVIDCSETKIYPQPDVKHEDLVADVSKFRKTLERFHTAIGINSKFPVIAKDKLNLHLLYKQVTSQGGLEQVIEGKKWKEVSSAFSFKSTPSNLSTVLRKHYSLLLWDFEQVYFFRKQGHLIPPPTSTVRTPKPISISPVAKGKRTATDSAIQHSNKENRKAATDSAIPHADKGKKKAADSAANPTSSGTDFVSGVITGECNDAYFVSVIVGSETLSGILFHPESTDRSA